ncbi:MAG: translation initiation factor IF-3 [Clostridia bacterium]|nr:translation initiation factor IF-3 [Clostridia bacterium]
MVWISFLVNPHFFRSVIDIKEETKINEEIREKEIRVIGPDGAMLGVMSSAEALEIANEKDLDLVMIAPTAVPPVCKVMDYGKYRFEEMKKEKEAKKKQKVIDIKEIRISPNIEQHDFEFKVKNAKSFLASGNKVKITLRFKGREAAYASLGEKVLHSFAEALEDVAVVDKEPKLEGRNMTMFLSPKNN